MSAGGVATLLWADYVKSIIPQSSKYAAAPDSGFAIDTYNYGLKDYSLQIQFINLYKLSNADDSTPNAKCAQNY